MWRLGRGKKRDLLVISFQRLHKRRQRRFRPRAAVQSRRSGASMPRPDDDLTLILRKPPCLERQTQRKKRLKVSKASQSLQQMVD